PMHLSRFITMASWAIQRPTGRPVRVAPGLVVAISTAPPGCAARPRPWRAGPGGVRSAGRCGSRPGWWSPSVPHLLVAPPDHGHLVALVPGRAEVVEREAELAVAADQVGRLDQDPGQRVMDAAAAA